MPGPRRINKGQRLAGIPADSWNGFVDTYHKVAQLRPPGHSPAQVAADDRSVVVKLRNDSGIDVPAGGVLCLDSPVVSPATRAEVVFEGLLFSGITPAANEAHVAIVQQPIADGAVGTGLIPGAAWAKVNVSDEDHAFAKPKASVDELESDVGKGFPIIWKESGTGAGKWAVVSFIEDTGTIISTATELIDADGLALSEGGVGEVALGVDDDLTDLEKIDVTNVTGKPIFAGSICAVWGRKYILNSNAAEILTGVWNGVGDKDNIESWAIEVGGKKVFTGDGLIDSRWNIFDPHSMLDDIDDESIVTFGVGASDEIAPGDVGFKFNSLFVIATNVGTGGGGGGFPWPGPGSGPDPGTATVSICTAFVNKVGGVNSSDATIPFDGASAIIGTSPGSGSANNTFLKAMCDDQKFLIISINGGGWAAMKADVNIILANVNGAVAAADATGTFDGAVAVEGYAPATAAGTFDNEIGLRWADNEQALFIHRDDGNWQPFKIPRLNLISAKVNKSGGVRPSDSTFDFDDADAIQGTAPAGGTGTANNVPTESLADNQVVHLVQRIDNNQWDLLRGGDAFFVLKGQPSTAITRVTGSFTCNTPTAVQGRTPVGAITVTNNPELKAGTGDTLYYVFDLTAGGTNATRWTTAHTKNHLFRLRGYTDYAAASGEYQVLAHDGDEVIRWMDGTLCNPSP